MALLILTAFSVLLLVSGSAMAAVDINTLDDLKAIGSGADGNGTTLPGWTMADEYILKNNIVINEADWISIGSAANPFTGKFDGNLKSITFGGLDGSGAKITEIVFNNNSVAADGFGLFGNIKEVNIHDLKVIVDANLTSKKDSNGVFIGSRTGVIAGNSTASTANSKLSNCHVIFNGSYYIEGNNNVGGLVGYIHQVEITDCSVQGGTIKSMLIGVQSNTGGLVGTSVTELIIKNSFSNTSILANGQHVGGLVGLVGSTGFIDMENCYFSGDVSGTAQIGGLVGNISTSTLHKSTLTKCYFTGIVNVVPAPSLEARHVGGLVGFLQSGDISECYSAGTINGIRISGGLVGRIASDSNISDCYSTSSVYSIGDSARHEPGYYAGGLIGFTNDNLNLSNCYAVGDVVFAPENGAGGLIGGISSTDPIGVVANSIVNVTNCYSLGGTVSSSFESGRVIGGVYDYAGDNSNFVGIRVWNGIKGNFDSNDSIILNIKDNTAPVSKNEVYKNESGWPSFDFTGIWEMSTTNYGLPVFVWQTEEPTMIPMNESRSGGSGTGSAVISNNNSTQIVQPSTPEPTIESTPTPQPTPTPEVLKPESQPTSQPAESKTSIWWYIIVIVLAIAIVGGIVYFVKFKK
jgi:Cobalamin biosynthesis protein CobN and related Mg-chelatases